MDFGKALAELKRGQRVMRETERWRGRELLLVPGSEITIAADRPLGRAMPAVVGESASYAPHIDLCTWWGGKATLSPWAATDEDLLAEDWIVMPDVSGYGSKEGE